MRNTHTLMQALSPPTPRSGLGKIGEAISREIVAIGYTCFGDLFLLDVESSEVAIAFICPFELVPIDACTLNEVHQLFDDNPAAKEELFQASVVLALEEKLGKLDDGEIYIPCPHPSLGGDGSLESF